MFKSVLVFMSNTGHGFQIEYPSITLHAISRQDGQPSIYCQLDEETEAAIEQLSHTDLNGTGNDEDEEGKQGDEVDTPMRELSIIPQNPEACKYHLVKWFIYADKFGAVEVIFDALSRCASLHPDPEILDEEEAFVSSDVDFDVFDGDEEQELSEVGRVRSDFVSNSRFAPY